MQSPYPATCKASVLPTIRQPSVTNRRLREFTALCATLRNGLLQLALIGAGDDPVRVVTQPLRPHWTPDERSFG